MSTQDSFIQIERRSSFNPYIWSDPKEELVTFKFQEKYYAALALITQVAFACIIASSLAICAIYAPYLIPGLLFSTYKLYEPIHCYIVIPLQEKGILAKEKMKIANGVVKKLVEIEGYCSSYSSYKNYFTENSLETAFIDHKDKLTSIDPTRICYRARHWLLFLVKTCSASQPTIRARSTAWSIPPAMDICAPNSIRFPRPFTAGVLPFVGPTPDPRPPAPR